MEQRSEPCRYDFDDRIMPSTVARRDLVWAQAALACFSGASEESRATLKDLHRKLVLACFNPDHEPEDGYYIKQDIQAELGEPVEIRPPNVLAITEFAKLVGYDTDDAQQVLPGLFIGNTAPAKPDWLEAHGVSCVVRCYNSEGRSEERDREYAERGIRLYEIPLNDNKEQELISFLPDAHRFIAQALDDGHGVLVHCGAGISRCAAVTSSFIMQLLHCNYHKALALIRAARPIVGPNEGFSKQLKEWEAEVLQECHSSTWPHRKTFESL